MSDEFSLWVAPDNRYVTFHGHLLASSEGRPSKANVVPEVTIYADDVGGYVVALRELMPEEYPLPSDDLERRQNLQASYGGAWPRSTVAYAGRFATLEAIAESGLEGFAERGGAAQALADAVREAGKRRP
jgi:hypothetical protein